MIEHHPSEPLLLDYTCGNLADGWALAVATHLSLCPDCRAVVAMIERTAGCLLETVRPEPCGGTVWPAIRARLTPPEAVARPCELAPAEAVGKAAGNPIPQPLRARLGGDPARLAWQRVGRGMMRVRVPVQDSDCQVWLVRLAAGKRVPEHGHRGRELTLVLAGSYRDRQEIHRCGDLAEADAGTAHAPVALEPCLCVAVNDAPRRYRNPLLRLLQPILDL